MQTNPKFIPASAKYLSGLVLGQTARTRRQDESVSAQPSILSHDKPLPHVTTSMLKDDADDQLPPPVPPRKNTNERSPTPILKDTKYLPRKSTSDSQASPQPPRKSSRDSLDRPLVDDLPAQIYPTPSRRTPSSQESHAKSHDSTPPVLPLEARADALAKLEGGPTRSTPKKKTVQSSSISGGWVLVTVTSPSQESAESARRHLPAQMYPTPSKRTPSRQESHAKSHDSTPPVLPLEARADALAELEGRPTRSTPKKKTVQSSLVGRGWVLVTVTSQSQKAAESARRHLNTSPEPMKPMESSGGRRPDTRHVDSVPPRDLRRHTVDTAASVSAGNGTLLTTQLKSSRPITGHSRSASLDLAPVCTTERGRPSAQDDLFLEKRVTRSPPRLDVNANPTFQFPPLFTANSRCDDVFIN
ncbi:hypothetical protein PHLCEN_2v13180 [Hermanssonia centrifuga]|uniref:Uncharacterized protein n=1 Tax=Hermanssonia centrifuga TaxID=98765 RepID=A0A2R6NFC1_9APHY|nr:hypothetical protein PHLCEN_2v13180 [Hermanssonia centrifuga]